MTDTEALIVLNMLPRVGPVRVRRLLERLGSPAAILKARATDLMSAEGIGREIADIILNWESSVDLGAELKRIEAFGAHVITSLDPSYPTLLKEIHDPPLVLYVWGDLSVGEESRLGVVGSRKPSHYATEVAKKLSYQLAYAGICVVSGLARGIDSSAHQGALAAKGRTIAVIGSGLQALYPPENQALAEKIASSGAVITEFSMATRADRQTFPMRNRIISGLSFGLLVVEAGPRSGSLISASQAAEQGRSLYAVPGRIDFPNAMGSNKLIQQGAKLVMDAGDILDDMGLLFPEKPELTPSRPAPSLNETEALVLDAFGEEEPAIDEIVAKCGLPTHVVSSTLLALEMRRLVRQLPGSRFVKIQ